MRLNPAKNLANAPFFSVGGFNNIAASAGLNVNALKAENATEIAMVIAN
jgi:hypothetical protein